jgi:hypothetical protein
MYSKKIITTYKKKSPTHKHDEEALVLNPAPDHHAGRVLHAPNQVTGFN